MKQPAIALILVSMMASCQPEEDSMNDSVRNARIDSLVALRMDEMTRQSMEDLDRRKAIEVKAKADSIIGAVKDSLRRDATPADNTIPNNLPMP
jgi:hypothetical protein